MIKTCRVALYVFFILIITTICYTGTAVAADENIQAPKTDSCVTSKCHADIKKDKYTHGPVGAGKCIICHGENEKHLKKPKRNKFGKINEISKKCYSCHEKFPERKYTHKPIQEGECTVCHSPHGSANKFQLVQKGGSLCYSCHDKALTKEKYVHGPAAVGGCAVCHEPHTADYKNNLKTEEPELCFMCHTEKGEDFGKAEFKHKPVAEKCTGCHNPHSAPKKYMLANDPPFLCYDCHKDKMQAIEGAPVKHGALTSEKTCMNCHEVHTSDVAKNLILPPMDLCMNCHDKQLEKANGETLADMKQLLTENTDHHGPIKQKDCSGCHNPHGSENFRILRNSYPSTFYKPFLQENYNLCFSCHEKTVVKSPVTNALTDFRNGEMNLHYTHVNKPEKGRTCRACHETHASNYPKHIRDSVPFGKWELPLNFEKTENGGSCMPGCHQLKKYDRIEPVENL
jgi:predicted CXXCH cytochrome family protein